MPDRNDQRHPGEDAPPGHSRSAHRIHGWCAHCKGRTPADEVIAWRVQENERHEAQQRAAEGVGMNASADAPRPCPECGELLFTVVTVRVLTAAGPRVAGGWAYCSGCEATPHPVWEEAPSG